MTRTPPKLALPWILEEDWPQWQDVDHGVPTYEKWVELFNRNLKLAESYNWPYQRVPVRPEPFNEWCKANQRTIGKFDRSLYALELLRTGGSAQLELPSSEDAKGPAPNTGDSAVSAGAELPADLPAAIENAA